MWRKPWKTDSPPPRTGSAPLASVPGWDYRTSKGSLTTFPYHPLRKTERLWKQKFGVKVWGGPLRQDHSTRVAGDSGAGNSGAQATLVSLTSQAAGPAQWNYHDITLAAPYNTAGSLQRCRQLIDQTRPDQLSFSYDCGKYLPG